MKKYRKLEKTGIFCFCLLTAFSFAACGEKNNGNSSGDTAEAQENTQAPETEPETAAESADTAGSDYGITIEQLVEANSFNSIISRNDNIYSVIYNSDGDINEIIFASADCFFDEIPSVISMPSYPVDTFYDGERCYYNLSTGDGNTDFAAEWFVMSDEEAREYDIDMSEFDPVINTTYVLYEKITEVTDNGDGTLSIRTILAADDYKMLVEQAYGAFPEDKEGAKKQSAYVVDAETLEIKSADEYELLPDGSSTVLTHTDSETNADVPETMQTMLENIEKFKSGDYENSRLLTVVYDPNTDSEETFSLNTGKEIQIVPYYREGYEFFNDPEGTEPFDGGDRNSDSILYCIKQDDE